MLTLNVIVNPEGWDEEKQEFVPEEIERLELEHSLVSLSKWEAKWRKPFLSRTAKTPEETIDYIKCMTMNSDIDQTVYDYLTDANVQEVNSYIENPMTATSFNEERNSGGGREIVTSELIYYWMVSLNIPFECEMWHLNRLLTLVKVCNIKNAPPKKMGRQELMSRNAKLNAARRARLGTTG